jgi:hypothetical protein
LGRSRTTPSQTAFKAGEVILRLFAYGRAAKLERGNNVVRKSSAADDCFILIFLKLPSRLKGVSSGEGGGVGKVRVFLAGTGIADFDE